VLLAIAAFSLSLLGTFLVRSGVLTSVHAFATDPRRGMFILAFLVGGDRRRRWLIFACARAEGSGLGGRFDTGVARVACCSPTTCCLTVACATVLLGTLYPLFIDALNLGKMSVGPPYFDAVFVPMMAPLVFLMGIGPLAQAGRRPSCRTWRCV
jgi:cytochrome c-type biogenesis protein CcmF